MSLSPGNTSASDGAEVFWRDYAIVKEASEAT